jgi:hypothetical protein
MVTNTGVAHMVTMKRCPIVLAATLALALGPATAFAQKVTTDWDKAASFTGYQTYSWTKGTMPAGANPLMVQRAQSAIEAELSAIGLVKVDANPDVLVALHGNTKEDVNLQTVGYGYGPTWRYGGGSSTTYVDRVLTGMLMVDLIDAKAKKLVWRATATDTVSDNPQKNEKKIHKAVEKMFEKYPTAAKTP